MRNPIANSTPIKILDKYYWNLRLCDAKSFYMIIYYLMFGLFFFILRGDLLSSIAYAFGMLSSFSMLGFLIIRFLFKRL